MYFWMGCITELLIWLYFCWHKGYCCVRVFVRDWCVAPRWAVVYDCLMNHWTFSLDSGHTPAGVVSGIVSLCKCAVKWKKIINYICIRETNLPVTLWAELLSLSGSSGPVACYNPLNYRVLIQCYKGLVKLRQD